MTRNDFLRICGILGIGLPIQGLLSSCTRDSLDPQAFAGKVLIIGAGAGGLSAGYLLHQQGIDFEILEASSRHGGRMKVDTSFADFPIPLGAEWLETDPAVLQGIVHDPTVTVEVTTVPDDPDHKFVGSSWIHFYEQYILPSISGRIRYQEVVHKIDHTGSRVEVQTNGGTYTADRVILSVPLQILQDGDISFVPTLPPTKVAAILGMTIWAGFKAFVEFSHKFYPDDHVDPSTPAQNGQRVWYDAAYGQGSNRHILGLFAVGQPALAYQTLTGDTLRDHILAELDALFGQQATPAYIQHIVQDWNQEPFIRSGYLSDHADWRMVRTLGEPVGNRLYFAGGEFTDGEDWVSVHTAALAARQAVEAIRGT